MKICHQPLLQLLQVAERERLGYPLAQHLLRFSNKSNTECYANGRMNVLLSNPVVSDFLLRLNSEQPLVLTLQALCLQDPGSTSSLKTLRTQLVEVLPRVQLCSSRTVRSFLSL